MKSVQFLEKKFPMTKKKGRQNFFRELKGTFKDFFLKIYFQKIFAPPIFVTQINFCPPIFMTSLRPCRYLRDLIRLPSSAISLRPLRSLDLFVLRARTSMAQTRAFAIIGPSLWNQFLPS